MPINKDFDSAKWEYLNILPKALKSHKNHNMLLDYLDAWRPDTSSYLPELWQLQPWSSISLHSISSSTKLYPPVTPRDSYTPGNRWIPRSSLDKRGDAWWLPKRFMDGGLDPPYRYIWSGKILQWNWTTVEGKQGKMKWTTNVDDILNTYNSLWLYTCSYRPEYGPENQQRRDQQLKVVEDSVESYCSKVAMFDSWLFQTLIIVTCTIADFDTKHLITSHLWTEKHIPTQNPQSLNKLMLKSPKLNQSMAHPLHIGRTPGG